MQISAGRSKKLITVLGTISTERRRGEMGIAGNDTSVISQISERIPVTNVKRITKVRLDNILHPALESVLIGGHMRIMLQDMLCRHFALHYILHVKTSIARSRNVKTCDKKNERDGMRVKRKGIKRDECTREGKFKRNVWTSEERVVLKF